MRTRIVRVIVLACAALMVSVAAMAQVDVVAKVQELLPLTCLTKAQVAPILDAIVPGSSANLTVAGSCLTKSEFAVYELTTLGIKLGVFEALLVSKLAKAQSLCILVKGKAADALTGMEFAVTLLGVIDYIYHKVPAPAGLSATAVAGLLALSPKIDALTPISLDRVLLPCLYPVPTS